MVTLLLFTGAAAILAFEGRMLFLLLAGSSGFQYVNILKVRSSRAVLPWALGFPLGAFLNALIFFIFTIFGIPLAWWTIFPLHALLIAALLFFGCGKREKTQWPKPHSAIACHHDDGNGDKPSPRYDISIYHNKFPAARNLVIGVMALSIAVKLFYGVAHAVMLPTYYYDSLSQWTMRSRVSYEDRAIAFDADERRGISKPQYPILLHSLQIFFMLPRAVGVRSAGCGVRNCWSDGVANGSTLLLTLSSFLALFLLLKRMQGTMLATIALWVLLGIPLVSMHLAQGFGDIHVVEYLLLAATFLAADGRSSGRPSGAPLHHGGNPCLLLSSMFVAAAAWVKLEGLVFGVVPWLVVVLFFLRGCASRETRPRRVSTPPTPSPTQPPTPTPTPTPTLAPAPALALALALPWPLLLLAKGLPLGPHGTAFALEWHPEAVVPAIQALFAYGSFGIHWYAVLGLGLGLGLGWKTRRKHCLGIPIIVFGLVTFAGGLFVYLFTPNVAFLLNAQTFSRTMLIPLSLLLLGFLLAIQRGRELLH